MKPHEEYWATAVHEAAHAVTALHEGLSLQFIQIGLKRGLFSSTGTGNVRLCLPGDELDVNDEPSEHEYDICPDEFLVESLASYPAEYRAIREMGYGQWKAASHARRFSGGDHRIASGYAEYASLSWRQAAKRAERIVDEQWEVIQVVAQELVDNGGYLAGLDVIGLVEECWAGASV